MVGNRRVSRRHGSPCWAMLTTLALGTSLLMLLVSPISAEDVSESERYRDGYGYASAEAYSEEGENLTTPATPLRRFVWRVRNWMFHRSDEDTNIEVGATEAAEANPNPTDGDKPEGECDEPRSWARSLAAWFARGIRHLLEHLYPSQDGAADGNNTELVPPQEGNPDDEDSVTRPPRRNVFRPWTALPPPYPPGMTASPPDSASTGTPERTATETSPSYTKPPTPISKETTIGKGTTTGKGSTAGSKSTDAASSSTPKKPRRRRPKTSTSSTTTTEMPPTYPPVSTEEAFIQDTGNEI